MYNRIILIGHLASDPRLGDADGTRKTTFRLATNTYVGVDEAGARRETTDFHTVVIFGKQAETAATYLQKGRLVHVDGRLHHRRLGGPGRAEALHQRGRRRGLPDAGRAVGSDERWNFSHSTAVMRRAKTPKGPRGLA